MGMLGFSNDDGAEQMLDEKIKHGGRVQQRAWCRLEFCCGWDGNSWCKFSPVKAEALCCVSAFLFCG